MAWETGVNSATKVVAIVSGEEKVFTFEGNTLLKDVGMNVATQMNFGSFLVKADGNEISSPNDANVPISNFRTIEIVPKYSGAYDESMLDEGTSDDDDILKDEEESTNVVDYTFDDE